MDRITIDIGRAEARAWLNEVEKRLKTFKGNLTLGREFEREACAALRERLTKALAQDGGSDG